MSFEKNEFFDTFQHKGIWWLPEAPQDSVPGTLTHTETETRLELFGSLREEEIESLGKVTIPKPTPVIFGQAEGVGQCTLFRNSRSNVRLPLGGKATSSAWTSQMLFVGAHIPDPTVAKFRDWSVTFSGLEEWIGIPPFQHEFSPQGQHPLQVTTRYTQPDTVSVNIPSAGMKLELEFGLNFAPRQYRSVTLERSTILRLLPDVPQSLEWFYGTLRDVQNFLLFCIGEPVYPNGVLSSLDGQEPNEGEPTAVTAAERRRLERSPVRVYYHYPHYREQRVLSPVEMLLPFVRIQSLLSEMLNHWFSKREQLRDVYGLFFSTQYNTELYMQSEFLHLIQAIETYCRAVQGADQYLPAAEYAKVAATLKAV